MGLRARLRIAMVVGFNHNFRYKGEIYHVQTEDGGLKSPNIVTLLYCGGTILSSQKTSYADITKVDNLNQVVEDLMKEQHKEMLRKLKDGEFDDRLQGHKPIVDPSVIPEPEVDVARPADENDVPVIVSEPVPATPVVKPAGQTPEPRPAAPAPPAVRPKPVVKEAVADKPAPVSAAKAEPAPRPKEPAAKNEAADLGLDDIILSYLVGDDDN